ncbi:MAG: hypothetical protein QOD06_1996 [Candidatus Binatota bacterium]|nr:hypothetical protein [Candidatus Binatota bacterium]
MIRSFRLALVLCAAAALPAVAFDWGKLVPPTTGGGAEDESAATGSAGARGIDEGENVARGGRDDAAVKAVAEAEPSAGEVGKFVEKGGLSAGTAPSPEPKAAAPSDSGAGGIGMAMLRNLDPTGQAGAVMQTAKGIVGLSPAEEHELGRRMAAEVFAQYGRDGDRDAEVYANLVAAVVGRNSDRPELHYHVGILRSRAVNAFSAPGGYLFVTRGALDEIEDEAELANVIGHEIAHVTERHIVREIQRANVLGGALSAARNSGLTSGQYDQLAGVGTKILQRGLGRKEELAADHMGAEFAVRAGYGSPGLVRFLERLKGEEGKGGLTLFPTHPRPPVRIAALESAGVGSGGAEKRLAERFRRFLPQR